MGGRASTTPSRTTVEGGTASRIAPGAEGLVFLPCSYTWANRGDAALFHATAGSLRDELGPVRLVLTSFTPEEDARRYGVAVLRMPLPPDGRTARRLQRLAVRGGALERLVPYVVVGQLAAYVGAMRLWRTASRLAPRAALRLLPRHHRAVVDVISRATVVAPLPGGYLMAPTATHYHWLYHAATLALCSLLGRPILLLPGSFGPFPGVHRGVARRVFSRCQVVMAREQASADHVAELGLDDVRIRLIPDTCFLLSDGDGQAELEHHGITGRLPPGLLVGVSVMHHDFPGCDDRTSALEAYFQAVADAMDWCVAVGGATPVFVTQVAGDGEASSAVIDRMRHGSRALCIDDDFSPFGLKAMYAKFELMVGTRMHANVLALAAGVPVVAVGYEHKTQGAMDLVGLGDYVVPISEPSRLQPALERAWAERDDTKRALADTLPQVRSRAREAARLVAAACSDAPRGRAATTGWGPH